MKENSEFFSNEMIRAREVLSTINTYWGKEVTGSIRAIECSMLRHGRFEADLAELYFKTYPDDLSAISN